MALDKGKHVMLSYNHKSKDIVRQVKEQLENSGIPVWFDDRDMEDNMFDRYVFQQSSFNSAILMLLCYYLACPKQLEMLQPSAVL
jgi:hypothetical protein